MANRFLSLEDLTHMPPPRWLVDGLFEVNSLVMVAGPSGSYKSFLVIDWVLSMITGRAWNGYKTVPQKVLYCLGEGKANLLKRIEAWMQYHQCDQAERDEIIRCFRVTFEVPQMAKREEVNNLLSRLVAEGFEPDVIVVDTFARSFVGLDENSQKDTGLWIEQADRLRQKGYTVIFLHHTAKNVEFGVKYRGSTAIMGAMDTAFTLVKEEKSGISTMKCSKQKDHDEPKPMNFNKLVVNSHLGLEGSMVLVPTVLMDERFTEDGRKREEEIESNTLTLVDDPTFESDRARAKELSRLTGLTLGAAQKRISRSKNG